MPHGHSHGGNKKADCISYLGTLDSFRDCAGMIFIGMDIYNTCYELATGEENDNPTASLCVGALMFLMSLGAIYVHLQLDTFHQKTSASSEPEIVAEDNRSVASSEADGELHTVPLINPTDEKKDEASHSRKTCCPDLTGKQKVALAADIWSHVIGGAGATVAVAQGITSIFTDNKMTASTKALLQLGGLVFSTASSGSSIRNCYDAMVKQNNPSEEEAHHHHGHSHGP